MGDMAQIGQNGAQMLNSGINAMISKRRMEDEMTMQTQRLAASERMQSARISASDPSTKAMSTYNGLKNLYSSHLQEIAGLEAEARPIMQMMQNNQPLSDEQTARITTLNNMTTASKSAFAALTKAGGEGSVEEERIDPTTGAKTKISYPNIQAWELHKGVSGGGQQKSAQELTDSYYPQTMKQTANPVAPVEEAPPAGFVPDKEEATSYASETDDMRKAVTELQLKRDSLARGEKSREELPTKKVRRGIFGLPDTYNEEDRVNLGNRIANLADKATSLMDYKLTDKERAASVRRLDAELAKKKKQIDSRQGN